jgi:hypothetical protein
MLLNSMIYIYIPRMVVIQSEFFGESIMPSVLTTVTLKRYSVSNIRLWIGTTERPIWNYTTSVWCLHKILYYMWRSLINTRAAAWTRKNKDPRPLRRKKIEQTRIPHKTGNERSCSVMVGNFCNLRLFTDNIFALLDTSFVLIPSIWFKLFDTI